MEARNDVESSKEMDMEAQNVSTGQVTGHQFEKDESSEKDEAAKAAMGKSIL